ncbi:MAG: dynamin family protein, partial [Cyanobacteria bacterium P01_G01_bin.49]
VEVYCDHSLLKMGVEFLDLPGTNDREEQNQLVKDKLLTADLIIQVVDARKLMTLEERENLRDWLLNRGVDSVILVINFLNLLEPQEQKEVYHRLRFIAESFRVNLPPGLSNLYRVDALPALREILKGDGEAAQTTGLSIFESALQSMVMTQKEKFSFRDSRIQEIINQVKIVANHQKQNITNQLEKEQQKQQQKLEITQKAAKIIQQGFQRSLSNFESWLYLPKLLTNYQTKLAIVLETGTFKQWHHDELESNVLIYQNSMIEWVNKAGEFLERQPPNPLNISFPDPPDVPSSETQKTSKKPTNVDDITAVGLPTGIGWVLGGPMGAVVLGGASYLLNKTTIKGETPETQSNSKHSLIYTQVAQDYLTHFSEQAFLMLRQYEQKAEKIMMFTETTPSLEIKQLSDQLQLLNGVLAMLDQQSFNESDESLEL